MTGRRIALMPWPARLERGEGVLSLRSAIRVEGPREVAQLFARRLLRATGIETSAGGDQPSIRFELLENGGSGEAYRLRISSSGVIIDSGTREGLLRGGETLLQLFHERSLPVVEIEDRPRFVWRGVLIDPARHFLPVDVVKRFLDCMAAVKLSVLHWHLSDDQGFRVECRRFPRLHTLGSDGQFYRQSEIAELIRYAGELGIRVVPEFDMPGHTESWLVAYPHLGSRPDDESAAESPRYELKRKWGQSSAALDPTREETFRFLEQFIAEMCSLFPEECFHIGGDEVLPAAWTSNPRIVSWMRDQGMGHARDLQAYFNQRIAAILEKCGKRMVAWDEVLHQGLPDSAIVQSWRGPGFLAEAVNRHEAILSAGYYLDQLLPASFHYLVDPHENPDLSEDERDRVLGGEACLWGEFIGPENLDSRAWPRLAAVAERLWSPRELRDVEGMYARLALVSVHLRQLGSRHLAGTASGPLAELATAVEPVKFYDRALARLDFTHTPLTRLVDSVPPESDAAREFSRLVASFCVEDRAARSEVERLLRRWRDQRTLLAPVLEGSPSLHEVQPVSSHLARVAQAGLEALEVIDGKTFNERWWLRSLNLIERAKPPHAGLVIAILPALRQLIDAAKQTKN